MLWTVSSDFYFYIIQTLYKWSVPERQIGRWTDLLSNNGKVIPVGQTLYADKTKSAIYLFLIILKPSHLLSQNHKCFGCFFFNFVFTPIKWFRIIRKLKFCLFQNLSRLNISFTKKICSGTRLTSYFVCTVQGTPALWRTHLTGTLPTIRCKLLGWMVHCFHRNDPATGHQDLLHAFPHSHSYNSDGSPAGINCDKKAFDEKVLTYLSADWPLISQDTWLPVAHNSPQSSSTLYWQYIIVLLYSSTS